jgi:hypothetical protein
MSSSDAQFAAASTTLGSTPAFDHFAYGLLALRLQQVVHRPHRMIPERTLRRLRPSCRFVDVDFADRELFGDIWILSI